MGIIPGSLDHLLSLDADFKLIIFFYACSIMEYCRGDLWFVWRRAGCQPIIYVVLCRTRHVNTMLSGISLIESTRIRGKEFVADICCGGICVSCSWYAFVAQSSWLRDWITVILWQLVNITNIPICIFLTLHHHLIVWEQPAKHGHAVGLAAVSACTDDKTFHYALGFPLINKFQGWLVCMLDQCGWDTLWNHKVFSSFPNVNLFQECLLQLIAFYLSFLCLWTTPFLTWRILIKLHINLNTSQSNYAYHCNRTWL